MKVIICGGGVIGTSTAYFLSQRNVEAVVVERTGVANGASGKSGGFLALDWCDGSPLAPLARRSFTLHEVCQLAVKTLEALNAADKLIDALRAMRKRSLDFCLD